MLTVQRFGVGVSVGVGVGVGGGFGVGIIFFVVVMVCLGWGDVGIESWEVSGRLGTERKANHVKRTELANHVCHMAFALISHGQF